MERQSRPALFRQGQQAASTVENSNQRLAELENLKALRDLDEKVDGWDEGGCV
jgi:hypothetical protein